MGDFESIVQAILAAQMQPQQVEVDEMQKPRQAAVDQIAEVLGGGYDRWGYNDPFGRSPDSWRE